MSYSRAECSLTIGFPNHFVLTPPYPYSTLPYSILRRIQPISLDCHSLHMTWTFLLGGLCQSSSPHQKCLSLLILSTYPYSLWNLPNSSSGHLLYFTLTFIIAYPNSWLHRISCPHPFLPLFTRSSLSSWASVTNLHWKSDRVVATVNVETGKIRSEHEHPVKKTDRDTATPHKVGSDTGPFRHAMKWWGQKDEGRGWKKEFMEEVSVHRHHGERLFGENLQRLTDIAWVPLMDSSLV